MFYSDQFVVDCPEGYTVIARPKEWSGSESEYAHRKAPVFRITIDETLNDQHAILKNASTQLLNLFEINTVLSSQLARCPVNDFILSLTDDACRLIVNTWNQPSHIRGKGKDFVEVCAKYIFLFQKKQKPSFS